MPSLRIRCRDSHVEILLINQVPRSETSLLIHLDNLNPQALRLLTWMTHKAVPCRDNIPLAVYIVQLELEAPEQRRYT